jgi:hypothetical protein
MIPLHHQINMGLKGLTPDQFKEIIEGPGSPLNFKERVNQITEKACASQGVTGFIYLI